MPSKSLRFLSPCPGCPPQGGRSWVRSLVAAAKATPSPRQLLSREGGSEQWAWGVSPTLVPLPLRTMCLLDAKHGNRASNTILVQGVQSPTNQHKETQQEHHLNAKGWDLELWAGEMWGSNGESQVVYAVSGSSCCELWALRAKTLPHTSTSSRSEREKQTDLI